MLENKNILVVEDSEDLIQIWKRLFPKAGLNARFVKTGQDALALVAEGFRPDLLMTDYYLPDTTGTELIEKLRASNENLKALVVTGNSNSNFKDMLPENTDYLVKPVRFQTLHEKLLEILSP